MYQFLYGEDMWNLVEKKPQRDWGAGKTQHKSKFMRIKIII
jgi:hypothetical protein